MGSDEIGLEEVGHPRPPLKVSEIDVVAADLALALPDNTSSQPRSAVSMDDHELALQLQKEFDAEEGASNQDNNGGAASGEGPIWISDSDDDDDLAELPANYAASSAAGPSKPAKAKNNALDADAELARQLQQEWDAEEARARATTTSTTAAQAKRARDGESSTSAGASNDDDDVVEITVDDRDLRGKYDGAAEFLGLTSKVAAAVPSSPDLDKVLKDFSANFKCPSCRTSQEPFSHPDKVLVGNAPCAQYVGYLEQVCGKAKCHKCHTNFCLACHEVIEESSSVDDSTRAWADHCPFLRLLLVYGTLAKLAQTTAVNEKETEDLIKARSSDRTAQESAQRGGKGGRGRGRGRGRGSFCESLSLVLHSPSGLSF